MRSMPLSLFRPKYTLSQWSNVTDRVYVVFKEVNASIYHGTERMCVNQNGVVVNATEIGTKLMVEYIDKRIALILCGILRIRLT